METPATIKMNSLSIPVLSKEEFRRLLMDHKFVGIELNADYIKIAEERLSQLLFNQECMEKITLATTSSFAE